MDAVAERSRGGETHARMLSATAAVLLSFPFFILFVSSALFAVGVPLSWLQLPTAAVLSIVFAIWIMRASFGEGWAGRVAAAAGVASAVFAACVLVERGVYDESWDGQSYHALGIHELAAGWNPVRGTTPEVPSYANELHYFAKGPWLLAASTYRFTGSFEGGKAFHAYFMVTAFMFWAAAVLACSGVSRTWAVLACLPIALNPVSVAQIFTYYVDGLLASLIAVTMALLLLATRRQYGPVLFPALAMALALAIATKLNGALFIVIIAGSFWAWQAAQRQRARALGAWLLVGVLIGAGITGYNPYTSQFASRTLTHGNPFYPHAHWSSILNMDAHEVVPGSTPVGRLARSLAARSVIWPSAGADYKIPFTFSRGELREFVSPDVRLGGFGPLFSGALLLMLATLIALPRRRRRLAPFAGMFVLAAAIVISVLVFPEAWWARLAPQLAFLPALVGIVGLSLIRRGPGSYAPAALILVLCANSALVFGAHATLSLQRSSASRAQYEALRHRTAPISVAELDGFPGVRYRLERAGVAYREAETLPCPEAHWQQLGPIEICAEGSP
jgi:hypothetical protein